MLLKEMNYFWFLSTRGFDKNFTNDDAETLTLVAVSFCFYFIKHNEDQFKRFPQRLSPFNISCFFRNINRYIFFLWFSLILLYICVCISHKNAMYLLRYTFHNIQGAEWFFWEGPTYNIDRLIVHYQRLEE